MNTFADTRQSRFASHAQSVSPSQPRALAGLRTYFAADGRRAIQSALGLIWLVDGVLQFQSFMYSSGFPGMLTGMEAGQPHWLSSSVGWGARLAGGNLDLWNSLFALTQVAIGLGLLFRPTVKLALAGSFVWVLIVWWFGEAFGMLFANAANPLTGAPGRGAPLRPDRADRLAQQPSRRVARRARRENRVGSDLDPDGMALANRAQQQRQRHP